jgi:TatD DNase family protein
MKTAESLEVIKTIPNEMLMLETDAPWCDIRPTHASFQYIADLKPIEKKKEKFEMGIAVKGRNEPSSIVQILRALAKIKGQDEETLAAICLENTRKVFFKNTRDNHQS